MTMGGYRLQGIAAVSLGHESITHALWVGMLERLMAAAGQDV